jgi:regulator of PEP synthase PpsR (kinase-PPPase family)
MGPIMDAVEVMVQRKPLSLPGLVRKLDAGYFQRVEAVEFAVKYDDAKDPSGILLADVVLLGVSRTSKTPLSQYLAHRKYKVVNVPIVPEVPPPVELYRISPKKCIGLTISAEQLQQIRKERLLSLGLEENAIYAQEHRILEELAYFHSITQEIGCPVIDVSNKAVEETASIVVNYLDENGSNV